MSPPSISISPATENDAQSLASIMTAAFSACDTAFPLIWGSAPEGLHDMVSVKGLFTPVQKEGRVTFKAVDREGKIVGFATWSLPKKQVPVAEGEEEKAKSGEGGLPELPGVNTELWMSKLSGPKKFYERDVDPSKDILLSFFFVDPYYQRQGIGSLLLKWGKEKADESGAKIWLTSTPQAVPVYQKNGWEVMDIYDIDLEKHSGEGHYIRSWMLRVGES